MAMPTTMSAMLRAPRVPRMTRERMSRPKLSVPNGCAQLGGFSRCSRCEAATSPGKGASSGAKIAIPTTASTMAPPSTAGLSLANLARISMSSIAFAQPRVDQPVHDIDQDVDDGVDDADQQGDRQHHLGIGGEDSLHGVKADAGPVENGLDHDGAGDQAAEQQADLGDRRDDRVAQHEFPNQRTRREALGTLVGDEILLQGLEHPGTG